MNKCKECDRYFDEPKTIHTTYESYYGVYSDFPNHTPLTYEFCPYCGSEDFNSYSEEEDEEDG